jgi:Tfp pilus assembly protein PilF
MRRLCLITAICCMIAAAPASIAETDNWRDLGPFGFLSSKNFPICLRTRPRQDAATCLPAPPAASATLEERAFAHEGRAIMYFRFMDRENSRHELDAALASMPNNVRLLHLKARFDMSEASGRAQPQYFISGLAAIDSAIALEPTNLDLQLTKATLLFADHRQDTALAVTSAVLIQDPSHAAAWLLAAEINTRLQYITDAIEAYERALALDDQSLDAHGALGQLYLQNGNPETAIRYFDLSIGRHKNDQDSIIGRARAYSMLGNARAALDNFSSAIEGPAPGYTFIMSDQDLARLLIGRAFVYFELKQNNFAAADVLRAVGLGGRPQILRMQLFLKRNGMTVRIDGKKTGELTESIRRCFGEDACRGGIATAL